MRMYQKLILLLAVIVTLSAVCCMIIIGLRDIRWDKFPVFGTLLLQIDKPAGLDASDLNEPITWEQIDKPPEGYEPHGAWFYINPYTLELLKDYMKENNLGIVPDRWENLHIRADFEELMETFEFIELDESYGAKKETNPIKVAAIVLIPLSVVSWVAFIILRSKHYSIKSR